MIFVTLGTQDKKFPRLLQALDKAIEKGEIEEKVIVQAGNTKYESENMDIFDFEISWEDMSVLECMPQTAWSGEHPDFVIPKVSCNRNQ